MKKLKISGYRMVKYIDSGLLPAQTDEIAEPVTISAIGYIVKETSDYITLAMELVETTFGIEYRHQVAIPKVSIIK